LTPATAKAPTKPADPAKGNLVIRGADDVRPAAGFPDETKSPPGVWSEFFAKNTPNVRAVQQHINYLTTRKEHEHVIALLNAAIIAGQAQPWMYEILAVTMEAAGRPPEEIDRVILSIADFGNASFDTMMVSGAYLVGFGRDKAALHMYQEASRIAPERPEPYTLSLKLAAKTQVPDDVAWAACGTLRYVWNADSDKLHRQAEDLLQATSLALTKATGQEEKLAEFNRSAEQARQRDLHVRLAWAGTGDLDLTVEDPSGSLANFQWRESSGGGYLRNDGYGPDPDNCHEEYVCPAGFSGEYVLRMKHVSGKIVGNRASVTIISHEGTPQEKKVTKSVLFSQGPEQTIRITLEDGRREHRRTSQLVTPQGSLREWERAANRVAQPGRRKPSREVQQVVAEFRGSRQGILPARAQPTGTSGGVGFAPIVRLIPEGSRMAAQAVVSPDRRYVRLTLSPVFSQIVDVAVFSFQGAPPPNR
jgi:hypothetical protein